MSTLDQIRRTIDLLSLLEKAQPREKPKWAEDNGLEFNEEHHRWMQPDTGEVHPHPENDSRWEESSNDIKLGEKIDSKQLSNKKLLHKMI